MNNTEHAISEERLIEISDSCGLWFQPKCNEPLASQKGRLVCMIEVHIAFLLAHLRELDETLNNGAEDHA